MTEENDIDYERQINRSRVCGLYYEGREKWREQDFRIERDMTKERWI